MSFGVSSGIVEFVLSLAPKFTTANYRTFNAKRTKYIFAGSTFSGVAGGLYELEFRIDVRTDDRPLDSGHAHGGAAARLLLPFLNRTPRGLLRVSIEYREPDHPVVL